MLQAVPAWALLLALLGVSLVLIFAGKSVVKAVAFLVAGLAGASIGGILAVQYLGAGWDLVGIVLGFVLGGLAGIALVALGIGLVIGYAAYLLALDFVPSATVAVVVGIVFFLVGLALYGKILTLVTALAGGFLLFDVLGSFGLGLTLSALIASLVTLVGLWTQYSPQRRGAPPPATPMGGQQNEHH